MSKGKSKDTLIDSHVSLHQCKLAIDALHAHTIKKEQKAAETELLPTKEQHVWLQVAVKKMQPEKKLKPFKIPIVHPLVDPRTSAVCLITKDPQREYKDLLESHGVKFISRVVGLTKLKGKFKPFEARRMLLKENGMFLADERVVPLLPGLLGSKWFDAKKQPIPVCLTRKDLKGELERAISSTYMHQNQGTCTSIKIATTSQSPVQALDNLQKALPAVVENLKGSWENVQSLHLKTSESVALPIWTCELGLNGEGSRWDGLVAGDESDEGEDGDEMGVDDAVVQMKKTAKGKGTKRPSEEEVQDEEKPKKKTKSAQPTPKKKRNSSLVADPTPIVAESPAPLTTATTEAEVPKKKKRKSKARIPDSPKLAPLPTPIDPPPTDTEADADIDTKPRKEKKVKAQASMADAGADTEPPTSVTLNVGITKEELKQKRSGEGGKRKKDKVVKKTGKSAKDAILGRKAGQS